jgi:hypothetical protein
MEVSGQLHDPVVIVVVIIIIIIISSSSSSSSIVITIIFWKRMYRLIVPTDSVHLKFV